MTANAIPMEEWAKGLATDQLVEFLLTQRYTEPQVLASLGFMLASFEEALADMKAGESSRQKRGRYIKALCALGGFLKTVGASRGVQRNFLELASGLSDLEQYGIVRDLLKPVLPPASNAELSDVWRLRADVCLGLEFLRKSGQLTHEKGAQVIAKRYPKLASLMGKKARSLPGAIVYWSREFRFGRVRNFEAQAAFDGNQDLLLKADGKEAAEIISVAHTLLSAAELRSVGH